MQQHLVTDRSGSTSGPALPVFPYDSAAESTPWPRTPGADDCPTCGTATVNVQGLLDCPDCDWSDRAGARSLSD